MWTHQFSLFESVRTLFSPHPPPAGGRPPAFAPENPPGAGKKGIPQGTRPRGFPGFPPKKAFFTPSLRPEGPRPDLSRTPEGSLQPGRT